MSFSVVIIWSLLCGTMGAPDTRGKEFVFGFLKVSTRNASIMIITSMKTDVVVRVTAPGFPEARLNETLVVTSGNVVNVTISHKLRANGTGLVEPKAVHVKASEEVTVYVMDDHGSNYFQGYPTDTLGREYYLHVYDYYHGTSTGMIVGLEDSTFVNVTYLKKTRQLEVNGNMGEEIVINRNDIYQLSPGYVNIRSEKDIALFHRTRLYYNMNMWTSMQTLPVQTWGRRFIVNPCYYLAPHPYTCHNCEFSFFSNKHFDITYNNSGATFNISSKMGFVSRAIPCGLPVYIESTAPGFLVHNFGYYWYTRSSLNPPLELYDTAYEFVVHAEMERHLNIYIKLAEMSGLILDGAILPNNSMCNSTGIEDVFLCQLEIDPGAHFIYHDSPNVAFGCTVAVGNDIYWTYSYPAGMRLTPINTSAWRIQGLLECESTIQVRGDGLDNDCDGRIDEELCNGADADVDTAIDEDCAAVGSCRRNPCHNRGECIDGETASCNCTASYRGQYCEEDACTATTCSNGGTCKENEASVECVCPPGFTGISCELPPYYLGDVLVIPDEMYDSGIHSVLFRCQFSAIDGYRYKIRWLRNADQVTETAFLTSSETKKSFVTDENFTDNGIVFLDTDVQIFCVAQVYSNNEEGFLESSISDPFLPVEVPKSAFVLTKGQEIFIPIILNIPFGCSQNTDMCALQFNLYNPDDSYTCGQMSIAVKSNLTCGIQLTRGMSDLSKRNVLPFKDNIVITTSKDVKFSNKKKLFSLKLRTRVTGSAKSFWKTKLKQDISVEVEDVSWRRRKYCYGHVDPHMRTFDGSNYENQNKGSFVLLQNPQKSIEVQTETKRCNRNRATCSCSITMKAGGDIFMINHCDGHYVGYIHDRSQILYVYESPGLKYEAVFPNGMRVLIRVFPYYEYTMNIDIYPGPGDTNQVEGLCGNFNGKRNDDFKPRGMAKLTGSQEFSMSWRINSTEQLEYSSPVQTQTEGNSDMYCVCLNRQFSINHALCKDRKDDLCVDSRQGNGQQLEIKVKQFLNNEKGNPAATGEGNHLIRKRQVVNTTYSEAKSRCLKEFQRCSVYENKHEYSEIDLEQYVHECALDVQMTGDIEWAIPHSDTLTDYYLEQVELDEEFKESIDPEIRQKIKDETCYSRCGGHGTCVNGSCDCDEGYGTDLCLVNLNTPPKLDNISFDGFCDVARGDDCTVITVGGDGFVNEASCNLEIQQAGTDGYFGPVETTTTGCSYLNFNEIEFYPTVTRNTGSKLVLVERIGISLSNNGLNFSDFQFIIIIDSACLSLTQDGNGTDYIALQPGYCYINRTCIQNGTISGCNTCDPRLNRFSWTDACKDSVKETNYLLIVLVTIGALIVSVAVGFVLWKVFRSRSSHNSTSQRSLLYRVMFRRQKAQPENTATHEEDES